MQEQGHNNFEPAKSSGILPGDSRSGFQLSAKLRDKLEKLAQWRIQPSSIEFSGDAREFRGGYATVSQAVLVSSSATECQDSLSVEGKTDHSNGEESKTEEQNPRARTSERKIVAVKRMKVEKNADLERVLGLSLRESEFLVKLSHPNIIKLEGFVEDSSNNMIWLVFPWEENGNLRDFIISEEWEIPERISLINDVTKGLEHLHSQEPPICHGDLKSLNVLVNSEYRAVITDFGSARRLGNDDLGKQSKEDENKPQPDSDPTTDRDNTQLEAVFCATTNTITLTGFNYTTRWAAPELLKDEQPTLACDIWSLGWIAYEVMTNTIPFHDVKNETTVVNRVVRGDLPAITNDARMSLIRALCALMVRCWSARPEKRPTAEDCRKSVSWMPRIIPAPPQATDTEVSQTRYSYLLAQLGDMYKSQGDYLNALSYYTKALDIHTRTMNVTQRAHTLCRLADLHVRRSEYSEAASFCSEALQIYTDVGDRSNRANALYHLAKIHRSQKEYSESIKLYSEALQIDTDLGDRRGRALALAGLAYVYRLQGEYSKATRLSSEALQIYIDIGDQREVAMTLWGLAEIRRFKGEFAEAIKLYSEALEIQANIGDQRERAITLWGIAAVLRARGEYSEAIERFSEALRINTKIGRKEGRARNLTELAEIHREQGHLSEAISLFLEASEVWGEIGDSAEAAKASKRAADIRETLEGRVMETLDVEQDVLSTSSRNRWSVQNQYL